MLLKIVQMMVEFWSYLDNGVLILMATGWWVTANRDKWKFVQKIIRNYFDFLFFFRKTDLWFRCSYRGQAVSHFRTQVYCQPSIHLRHKKCTYIHSQSRFQTTHAFRGTLFRSFIGGNSSKYSCNVQIESEKCTCLFHASCVFSLSSF